jgi:peptide/nickel transport system permease protein
MLSRLVWGGRSSCIIAALTTGFSLTIGMSLGLVAGHFRGRVDLLIAGLADFMLAFPGLVLLLILIAVLGPSIGILVIGLGIFGIPVFIRITRAHALTVSQREFVLAARGSGAGSTRVIVRHLLPNVFPPVLTYALTFAATVFVAEGALSFLGFGLRPPSPSWGEMIASGESWLNRDPYLVILPSILLVLTVLALNFLGSPADAGAPKRGVKRYLPV